MPIARAAGYEGSARNFRRLVAEQKALWRKDNHRGRRPAVWSPGEYLVIDWAEAAPGLFVFCAVLAFSRWRFVRFAADQKASTTLAMIAEALTVIGGVPAKVLADRMGCLKGGVVANVVVPTADYVRFAGHYGFRPDWCEAGDPASKGIVEHLCGYAQSDLVVPLLTEAQVSGVPVSLPAANAAAAAWCAEVNAAVHSEICRGSRRAPGSRAGASGAAAVAAPRDRCGVGDPQGRPALVCPVWLGALLGAHPADRGHREHRHRPRGAAGGGAGHRGDRGRTRTRRTRGDVDHRRALRRAPALPSRGPRPKTTVEQQFCALGEDAEAFLVGAAAIGNTRLGSELEILLGLGAAHGEHELVAALRRAVAFKRFRAADVRSILAAGTGPRSPAPPATRWCWTCPPRRRDPWTPTRSRPVTGAAHDHHNRYENRCPQDESRICLPIWTPGCGGSS